MHRAILAVTLALLLVSVAGCSDKTAGGSGGCGGNAACEAGQVCNNDVCQTLCAADTECASTEICSDQLCVAGSRPQPTLTFVDGDGTAPCPDGTAGRHCLHAGLLIQGTNLLGSSFKLVPSPTGTAYELTVRSGATDVAARVDLPDVPPGGYLLTATNNSGSADQALTLLQGEPGENFTPTGNQLVDSINTATNLIAVNRLPVGSTTGTVASGIHAHAAADVTSGIFDPARIPTHTHPYLPLAGGTLTGDLTVNTNVTVNGQLRLFGVYKNGDAAPTTYTYAPRRYIVDAPASKVGVVVPLDQTLVSALCKTIDGCMLTVVMIDWDGTGNVASRHERLFLSTTSNQWRLSNDTDGIDGNSSTQEWSPWDCSFTDAETSTGSGNARADNGAGFGLLNQSGGSYNDANTSCRVIIEN